MMISSINRKLSLRLPGDISGFIRSILIGLIGGTIFLPVFFAIWIGISFDKDFVRSCDEHGTRKADFDHYLVLILFVVWLVGIVYGYLCCGLRGVVLTNLANGAISGACLGFWLHLHENSSR